MSNEAKITTVAVVVVSISAIIAACFLWDLANLFPRENAWNALLPFIAIIWGIAGIGSAVWMVVLHNK